MSLLLLRGDGTSGTQAPVTINIKDNDTGLVAVSLNSTYPTAKTSGTAAEKVSYPINLGREITEGQSYPFWLILNKAHAFADKSDGSAPLQVRIAALLTFAGFNHDNYTISGRGSLPAGVTVRKSTATNDTWGWIVDIKRSGTSSATVIPLNLNFTNHWGKSMAPQRFRSGFR